MTEVVKRKKIMNFGQFIDKFDPDVQQLTRGLEEYNKKIKRIDHVCKI